MKIYKVEEIDTEGYIFPDASGKVPDFNDQLIHIMSEVIETYNASESLDYEDTLVEIYDIIHSCESLLRFLDATSEDREKTILKVIQKNADRGYYGG